MIPSGQKMTVSRQVVENALQLFKSKAKLQQEMLDSHIQWSVAERKLVTLFVESQGFTANPAYAASLREWQERHKQKNDAEEELMRVALSELNSQVAIHEAMLKQGQNLIHPAGPAHDLGR